MKKSNKSRSGMARQIWQCLWSLYDEIPGGFIIHHIDGNPQNDNISNLACMTHKAHAAIHQRQGDLHNGSETISRVFGTRPEDFIDL